VKISNTAAELFEDDIRPPFSILEKVILNSIGLPEFRRPITHVQLCMQNMVENLKCFNLVTYRDLSMSEIG